MGNKVSDYLERFRKYCLDQLIEKRYYMYGGSNPYTLARKNFYSSFVNNDVFKVGTKLHKGVFYTDDFSETHELLTDIMEWLRDYIKSFDSYLRAFLEKSDNSSLNFKRLNDAIEILKILKLHFTWYSGNVFDGKSASFFERNYFDFADEPFEMVPKSLINSRINGFFGDEFYFNYIFYYKAFNKENCDQLMELFSMAKNNYSSIYDGMLLFTPNAMWKFLAYLQKNSKYRNYEHTEDEDGYHYISLSTEQTEKFEYVCYSTYKMVFHLEENGLYKLVAFKAENHSFDMNEYRDAPSEYCGYSNDERFKDYLVTEKPEISVPKYIDVFV